MSPQKNPIRDELESLLASSLPSLDSNDLSALADLGEELCRETGCRPGDLVVGVKGGCDRGRAKIRPRQLQAPLPLKGAPNP